ncbi:xanthine dehydrogenase molybdopterin binding subunit [Leeia sp.]|uniref:xanthine dehydrogenase molybdopterin binding subunit n=1 Tax=Leeia sp. TaxID=2884678 RepID=UPI0035B3E8A6
MSATHLPGIVGHSVEHESARLHVSGRAPYTDDLPELKGTLHAALGLSSQAHARILSMNLDAVRQAPGVRCVITAADIPGANLCGPVLPDEPILATDTVHFLGQALFAVAAETREQARRAARLAQVSYEPLPAILTTQQAVEAESWVLPPVELRRGEAEAALAAAPHRLQGQCQVGGQEQFYLEGQIAYALPKEQHSLLLYSSTQHPTEMQHMVAHALGWLSHDVTVECRRMGGGFGGKESQSALFACAAALLAQASGRPVKLRADRDDDFMLTGKRHDFVVDYDVGFDDEGRILGLKTTLASRCGWSADLSGPVNDRAVFHLDNAYYLDAVAIRSLRGRTNTQSNTAFRGFGGPQGVAAIEYIVDDIARTLGRDPLDVRYINLYGGPDGQDHTRLSTHYGMEVEDNCLPRLLPELEASSDYRARREAIRAFNASSPVLKRGIALTPVKFGISFTATFFNQAGALLHVYTDGSVLLNHGGTEMGQGLNTKVAQVVAHELGLALSQVRVTATDTSKVPNTSATAASSGTDLNGKAAQHAAQQIKARLVTFLAERYQLAAEQVHFAEGQVRVGEQTFRFAEVVKQAYLARVSLSASGFYKTPKIHYDSKTLTGRPFYYFAYGAAVAEVIIDTLTGESKLLRADILHDVGRSINPALDIGQIEGGFVQGMGWLTTEELYWNAAGKLMTHAPSTYKIPAASDVPADLRVALFDNANVEDSIHRSKAVGEPPLMLAFSVFHAIRDAVASVDDYQRNPALNMPATPEAVLQAVTALRG